MSGEPATRNAPAWFFEHPEQIYDGPADFSNEGDLPPGMQPGALPGPLELADVSDLEGVEQPEWESYESSEGRGRSFGKRVDLGKHFNGMRDTMTIYAGGKAKEHPDELPLAEEQGMAGPVGLDFFRTDPKTGREGFDLTGGGKLGSVLRTWPTA